MKRIWPSALTLFLVCAAAAWAQPPTPAPDPIAPHVFLPELVMRHASDIALDERQRAALKDAVVKMQSRFLDLQWDVQGESEKLGRLLQARPVDETAVLAQADKVMGLEREIKKAHLSLLVRIKNLLTDAQQEKLRELRRRSEGGP